MLRTVLGLGTAGLVVLAVVAAARVATPARAGDDADRAASPVASITVEGTVLKITLTDGRVLASRDLIGASLLVDQGDRLRRVRLDGIERDPDDKRRDVAPADVIWLHSYTVEGPDGSWGPLCDDGPDGRRHAICKSRSRTTTASQCRRISISTMRASAWSGPTTAATAQAPPETGCSSTSMTTTASRRPTPITAWPSRPAGRKTARSASTIPASRRTSRENIALGEIAARWSRLAGRNGASCTEETARSLGALLFNRSEP